jgi:8-oxo-dGTP pyrophosphatase MutT (NUDIX family)
MKIPIVDEHDKAIAYKNRESITPNDIVRTASLWVKNSNGEVLIAQRSFSKKNNPGKWSEAVGGTVEGDETYETTMLREAKEEIGLEPTKYEIGPKQLVERPQWRYFVQWYVAIVDLPVSSFAIQKRELEGLAWIDEKRLAKELIEAPGKYINEMAEIAQPLLTGVK